MKSASSLLKSGILVSGIALLAIFVVLSLSQIVVAQYTGTGNHVVSLSDAQRYIQNFWNKPVAPTNKAVYFDRNIYEKILSQPGCVGIRQYYAFEEGKGTTLVLVGVDSKGNDIIGGTIGEAGNACPPYCAPDTKLY